MENDISLFAQSRRSCSDLVSLGKAAPDPLFDKSLPRASKGEAEGAKLFHRNSGVSIKASRMFKVVFKMFCIFFISVFFSFSLHSQVVIPPAPAHATPSPLCSYLILSSARLMPSPPLPIPSHPLVTPHLPPPSPAAEEQRPGVCTHVVTQLWIIASRLKK